MPGLHPCSAHMPLHRYAHVFTVLFWSLHPDLVFNSRSVPPNFFPEAKCKLGAPNGQFQRVAGTWTYKRQFEHASVLDDLNDRNASKVTFDSC